MIQRKETTIERLFREVTGRKMPLSVKRILLRKPTTQGKLQKSTRAGNSVRTCRKPGVMENYIPKMHDTVMAQGYKGRFTVTRVDTKSETADLESTPVSGRPLYTLASVTWKVVSYLDASKSALRTREAL
jgi:hypothetical protein